MESKSPPRRDAAGADPAQRLAPSPPPRAAAARRPALRSFALDEPFEPLADAVEQWLLWEQQANLIGFRTSTEPVEIEVAEVPRDHVVIEAASDAPPAVTGRFLRGDRVRFPKHPLNTDRSVAFFDAPVVERWTCRYTSSRTLVAAAAPGEALFSLKLATDHPHPDFHQPEKTRLREEATWGLDWVELIDRVDGLLGRDPALRFVREVLVILVREGETACVVRDLRGFQDGHYYLPGLSLPWVGRQIARKHGESFERFWGRHWAAAVGRAKAALLARYGLWYETPNPQNLLLQLDRELRPTGVVVFRDGGDTECATDADSCSDVPWTSFRGELRPETENSFWAFGEAGTHAVARETLETWYVQHDAAYFAELGRWLPELTPDFTCAGPEARGRLLGHWNAALHGPAAGTAIRRAFARRRP